MAGKHPNKMMDKDMSKHIPNGTGGDVNPRPVDINPRPLNIEKIKKDAYV